MDIQSVINVNVSIAAPGITQLGFGEPCVLFYGDNTVPATNPITDSELVRRYASSTALADMFADGFAVTSPAYLGVQAIVSQTPHPETVKVARSGSPFSYAVELTPLTFAAGETLELTISKDGVTRSYSRTAGGVSIAAEATALAVLLNADVDGWGAAGTAEFTVAGVGDILEIDAVVPANAGEIWYFSALSLLSLEDVTVDRGIAGDLAAISLIDLDWYALVPADAFGGAELLLLATWAAAQTNKIVCASTQDLEVVSAGTGIGADLVGADRGETLLVYSRHSMAQYPGGAMAGRFLPESPGSEIWAFKTLSGVTPSNLTTAEITNAVASYVNIYTGIEAGGVEIVRGNCWKGWSSGSSETFIDTIRLIDATVAEVQSRALSLMRSMLKVPYTDKGLASIKGAILSSLRAFMPHGYDEGSAFCGLPLAANISDANKQARLLPGVTFGATLSGGITRVNITGQLSY
jgi:hypothetical protein